MNCQRAVFLGPNKPFRLESVFVPQPRGGEAIVRIDCCTICGSDLHTYQGKRREPTPTILGHEIMGTLYDVDSDLRCARTNERLKPGDRVTWSIVASCSRCSTCQRGLPQKCENLFKYGHAQLTDELPLSGGMAEFCQLVPGTTIIKLPAEITDPVAAPANCATATVAAAIRTAGPLEKKSVAIIGAGMLGVMAIAMARECGAVFIAAYDIQSERLSRATEFGADTTLLWTEDPCQVHTEFDVVIELSGNPSAVEKTISMTKLGGTIVLVGSVIPTPRIAIDPESIVRRWLTIRGVHNYAPRDLVSAVDFLAANRATYPFDSLIADNFSLDSADEAFEFALTRRPYRVAVVPR